MTSLSPGDANALVQLRALLEHARQSVNTASPTGRLTALVLLDAVNERVIHLAAQTLPDVQIASKDSFEDMYSKVKAALASGWARDNGWAEVRKLHRARNAAQHEGLGADPSLLPGWAIATEKYTRTLAQATFAVNIDEVYLADAIVHPKIASQFRIAEDTLGRGDIPPTMKAIAEAFRLAFDSWIAQHSRAHQTSFTTSLSGPFSGLEGISQALDQARDLVIAQAFATDPAEYTWYSHLQKADPVTVTVDEARRALAFVFWWIIRWEAISQSIVSDSVRRERLLGYLSTKMRKDDRPARLKAVTLKPYMANTKVATFELENIPPSALYDDWCDAVAERLRKLAHTERRYIGLNDANIIMEVSNDVDAATLVQRLTELLRTAEGDMIASRERRSREKQRLEVESVSFADEIAAITDQIPTWVDHVFLTKTIDPSGTPSRLRMTLTDNAKEHCDVVISAIRNHPLIDAAFTSRNDSSMQISPEFTAADIVSILRSVDAEVSSYIQNEQQRREHQERASAELLERFQAAIQQT